MRFSDHRPFILFNALVSSLYNCCNWCTCYLVDISVRNALRTQRLTFLTKGEMVSIKRMCVIQTHVRRSLLHPPYTHEKDLETAVKNAVHHIMSHDEALQRKVLSFLRRTKHIPDTCESMKKVLGACPGDTAIVSMLRRHYPFDDSSDSIFINVLKNTFEDK